MVSEQFLQQVFRSVLLLRHLDESSILLYQIYSAAHAGPFSKSVIHLLVCSCYLLMLTKISVTQIKPLYNSSMAIFRYGRTYYEEGEFVRRVDAMPGDELDPVVRVEENLGTVEIPCGKVDCRSNCLEYLVRAAKQEDNYPLAECKISPLVNIL